MYFLSNQRILESNKKTFLYTREYDYAVLNGGLLKLLLCPSENELI